MISFRYILLFVPLLLATACQQLFDDTLTDEEFYTAKKIGDLWRVPVLNPYEVVSPANASDWFFILNDVTISGPDFLQVDGEFQFTDIDYIGCDSNYIILTNTRHNWMGHSDSPPTILIFDMRNKTAKIFSMNDHQTLINEEFKLNKLDKIQLHKWDDVCFDFQKSGKLPADWPH